MQATIFQAALWCGPCTVQLLFDKDWVEAGFDRSNHNVGDAIASLWAAHDFNSESDYDSDQYPKGPYEDGGGEADCPQHCDACGTFLENPLTEDGYRYLAEAVSEHVPNYADKDWREVLALLLLVSQGAKDKQNIPDMEGPDWKHIAHSSAVVADWVAYYEPLDWKTG